MASAIGTTQITAESAALELVAAEADARPKPKSGFTIGPVADSVFIIRRPALGAAGRAASLQLPESVCQAPILGKPVDLRQAFLISFIMAHLVLVFFRGHANASIFWTHPIRFTVVPLALFVSMVSSFWIFGLVGVLGVWWDVYHFSLQVGSAA